MKKKRKRKKRKIGGRYKKVNRKAQYNKIVAGLLINAVETGETWYYDKAVDLMDVSVTRDGLMDVISMMVCKLIKKKEEK